MTTNAARRILIVEDNVLLAMVLGGMVEDLGHCVVGPVLNLQDGLAHARSDALDFALLDFDLGVGVDVIPIVEILTARGIAFAFASGTDSDVIRAAFPDAAIIGKPVREDALIAVLS